VINDVPGTLPGGSTNMVEGIYRGWDELRSVPTGSQSGLRVIGLFTDGASNSVPANYDGTAKGLRTYDFPQDTGDSTGQTRNRPHTTGLYDTATGNAVAPNNFDAVGLWDAHTVAPGVTAAALWLPATSWHTHHRSSGIPTQFPLISNTLRV